MIRQKKAKLAASTTQDAFCDEQVQESQDRIKELEHQLEKEKAALEKQSAQFDELKMNIADSHSDIASAYRANSDAVNAHYGKPKGARDEYKFEEDQKQSAQFDELKMNIA